MLHYVCYICFDLAYAILALDEIAEIRHRNAKVGKVIAYVVVALCLTALMTYFAALFFGGYLSFAATPMSALFLISLPIINNVGRQMKKQSAARLTCYWVALFVSVIAIVVRIIGL